MYINNPKRLFKDLKDIEAMRSYMEAVEDDGMQNDISNLISIVEYNKDLLHDGDMDGSNNWDLSQCETEEDKQQLIEDSRKLKAIYRRIQKELSAKYVVQCVNCGYIWFYQRRSKCIYSSIGNDTNTRSSFRCGKCNSSLNVYTMEEWLVNENLYNVLVK